MGQRKTSPTIRGCAHSRNGSGSENSASLCEVAPNLTMATLEDLERELTARYESMTPRSRELATRAEQVLPGGDTRTGTFFLPYPTYMQRGEGSELVDVDGNRYVDFLGNYTSLIHGHAHPRIAAAITDRAALGTATGFPDELQVRLAEVVCERVPSLEQLRFCNSGTEAIMNAVRAARAFTGRRMVLKIEGGYNGSYDVAQVSVSPGLHTPEYPTGVADGPGVSPGILAEVLVAPFNDLERLRWILSRYGREVSAVLVEPVVSSAGMILPDDDYLEGVISAARSVGALTIFDEIVTFRLGTGGMQGVVGVEPDLTTLGKIIGGGLPVGAFGGRRAVMEIFDPRKSGGIAHSGTYNGNALTMAAGLAALEGYGPGEIDHVGALGLRLRTGLQFEMDTRGVLGIAQGIGSLAHLHFCAGPVRNYREALMSPAHCSRLVHLGLLVRGYSIAKRTMMAVNTAMDLAEVDGLVAAFGEVLDAGRDVFPRVREAAGVRARHAAESR